MSKRTVIRADEELVIKGKLTIEGNVTQIETTQVVTNLEGNVFTINSDGSNTSAVLAMNSNGSIAQFTFSSATGNLALNVPLSLGSFPITTTGNITGAYFIGNGSTITGLTTSIVAEGTNLYFTAARARGNISVSDAGGDGSLSYDSGNGIITYTGPSQSEANARIDARLSGGDGIDYTSGVIDVDSTVVRTSGDQTIANTKTFTGSILLDNIEILPLANNTANIGSETYHINKIFAAEIHTEYLNLGADANISDIHDTFYVLANGALDYQTNIFGNGGAWYGVVAGDGITTAANTVAVDNTVIRTNALDQTISGNLTLTGNLSVVNIDSQTQTDSLVTDKTVFLNVGGGATPNNSGISVEKSGGNVYIEYNDRWQFSNDGSNVSNILLFSDFSAGDGVSYSNGEYAVVAGDGISVGANVSVDTTVIRTTGDQTLANAKTFVGELIIPAANSTANGAIYSRGNQVFAFVDGIEKELTPQVDIGVVTTADAGNTGIDVYAGMQMVGNVTTHFIRSIDAGSLLTISEASNVITLAGNSTAITGLISVLDNGGDGSLSYNNTTGVFTYTGPSAAEVRAHISGTGLISYSNTTGVISTTADNYGSWTVQTDSGVGAAKTISSSETLTIQGGTNITVTNTGNVITIVNDNAADITEVNAGDGLTGGGVAGNVSLAVGAGDGITVNADNVAVNVAYVRNQFSAAGDLSYNTTTGVFSFTNDAGDIEGVTAGDGLTGGGTSGNVTLNVGAGTGITVNADNIAVNMAAFTTSDLAEGSNLYFTAARANTAMDAYLVAGGGLLYSSGTFAVGAGSYIIVGANDVSVDATPNNTANKVVARDANGSFAANVITATATSARYADLAENYLADSNYESGTVLVFGGEAEVTQVVNFESTRIAGVVTTQPAHVMNSHLTGEHVVCIALRGRIPVKVKGVVRKGDVLVSAGEGLNGYAVASLDPRSVPAAAIVGKAIEDKLDTGVGFVEALI